MTYERHIIYSLNESSAFWNDFKSHKDSTSTVNTFKAKNGEN